MVSRLDYFKEALRFFELGLYDDSDIWDFVSYEVITPEQYKEIIDNEYPTERPEQTT